MELDTFLKKIFRPLFYILVSLAVVSLGQPAFIPWMGVGASFVGYALFWQGLSYIAKKKTQFYLSWAWFSIVHAIGIDWMCSTTYVGKAMYIVYVGIALLVGLEFALASSILFLKKRKFTLLTCFAFASIWTVFEWIRLFFFSGYTWNPVGLALAANSFSCQIASLFGMFGLSFFVMVTNVMGWRALFCEKTKFYMAMWIGIFCIPFAYGYIQVRIQNEPILKSPTLNVACVQTSFFPEEHNPLLTKEGQAGDFLKTPWDHWKKILNLLKNNVDKRCDLIILPEVVVPIPARLELYSFASIQKYWKKNFCSEQNDFYPVENSFEVKQKTLSNLFIAQTLSNFFECEMIIGLEDYDPMHHASYNAAFFIQPFSCDVKRYKKQVLVPITEYFPFSFCKSLAKCYGISDAFFPGKEPKVFFGDRVPVSMSICYEETFGNLMRKNRQLGSKLFVNISNDVWFPHSRLAQQQFELGRMRAIENGVPLIRACNTGVTIAIDSLGRTVASLEQKKEGPGVLRAYVPTHCYKTLYTSLGDQTILVIALSCIALYLKKNKFLGKKKFSKIKKNRKSFFKIFYKNWHEIALEEKGAKQVR